MRTDIVSIREAKARLSKLIDQAAAGKDVVIARNGRPVARITGLAEPGRTVKFGLLKGRIRIAADFDAPLSEPVLRSFVEGSPPPG